MITIPTIAPENANRITVTAYTNADGEWVLVDNGGNTCGNTCGDATFDSKEAARAGMEKIWPASFPWFGEPDGEGWSIVIE